VTYRGNLEAGRGGRENRKALHLEEKNARGVTEYLQSPSVDLGKGTGWRKGGLLGSSQRNGGLGISSRAIRKSGKVP